MTIANRKYDKLYVSLWYILATMMWGGVSYFAGNWVISMVPQGISRVNMNFFYVHNLVGLIFTPMGLAIAYYFLPKMATLLSIPIDFLNWLLVHCICLCLVRIAPYHSWTYVTVDSNRSDYLSIWLFVPVWTAVTNLFGTLKGIWHKYNENAAIRFIIMGTLFYLMVSTQGSFMAVRNVNEITSKTDWVIGHAHMSLYGTFTFFAIAGIYGALPALSGNPLYSKRMADGISP